MNHMICFDLLQDRRSPEPQVGPHRHICPIWPMARWFSEISSLLDSHQAVLSLAGTRRSIVASRQTGECLIATISKYVQIPLKSIWI